MNHIHTLSITCVGGVYLVHPYRFVLAMPAQATLDELGSCVLSQVDFDGDHWSGFYVANTRRGKGA